MPGEPCKRPPNPTFTCVCSEIPPVHGKTGQVLYVHQNEEGGGQQGISAPIPPVSLLPPFLTQQHHSSFPVQHDSRSVPCGKPKGFGEMLQDHAGNISGGLHLGREPAWGNGRYKPSPQLTTRSVGHHHHMPISSIHWAWTRAELEEFQTQMNPIQN